MSTIKVIECQSPLNRQAELSCSWGAALFAYGTIAHVVAAFFLVSADSAGLNCPHWLQLCIIPTIPIFGLVILGVNLPLYYLTIPSQK
jgi:hypothetical protein